MKPLKIYFLSSEIFPFSNTYSLSKFSRDFSTYIHENKSVDIRLCQPKYGYISERKYILREVIRLRDMEIDFAGKQHVTNLKSAFIPETRVQVYFMEHADYFADVPELLYKSRNGRLFQNNHEKFLFYISSTFETMKKLFWVPDFIICNDWQTVILSQIIKEKYKDNDLFKNIKIISFIHSYNDNYLYSNSLFEKMGISYNKKEKKQNALNVMREYSDLNYIFDDGKLETKIKKTSIGKSLISSKKTTIFESCDNLKISEKIDMYDKIIDDLKSIS
ncbi:MAG: hypothetical protein CMG46_01155 [Candidatus Marinimicrobia bacterium]|nr:hypothetical protein [Candidatus Neomarinimicrobiota bacterium]